MATRWSLLLIAGLTGCTVHHRGSAPTPRLLVVVGTEVRYCDGCDDDVFFYSDYWWAYRSGGWYRSATWGAPWIIVETGRLPVAFIRVPPGRFKHRFGPRHPAHAHHPAEDRWPDAGEPGRVDDGRRETGPPPDRPPERGRRDDRVREDADEGNGERDREQIRNPDDQETVDQDKAQGKGKGKVKEKARGKDRGKDKEKAQEAGKKKAKPKSKVKSTSGMEDGDQR